MSGVEGGVQIHSAFGMNLDKELFRKTLLSFSNNTRSENKGLLVNEERKSGSKVKKANTHQIFVF